VLYVTFLRHPVQQFLSYLYHVRGHFSAISDPALLSCLPPNLPRLSLRETADWILAQRREINFSENYTINFFANPVAGHLDDNGYRRARLGIVQNLLRQFFFVGIAERLDQCLDLLRDKLAPRDIKLPAGPAPVLNTSLREQTKLSDISWIHEHDRVGKRLLESVAEDDALYRWAVERLERSVRGVDLIKAGEPRQ
jgi:hypothetical protein